MRRLVLCLIALVATAGNAWADGGITAELGGGRLDWTAGELVASGAAAADLRAPSVAVARVGAERRARERARAALADAATRLPLAAGGTLGKAAAADAALAGRIRAVLEGSRDVAVELGSDGSARVTVAAPLEALRSALVGVGDGVAPADAPTALLIEAGAWLLAPRLGLELGAGDQRLGAAVVYFDDATAAARDPRLGPRVVRGRAVGFGDGMLVIEGAAARVLPAARAAAALVVVVMEQPKRRRPR